MHDNSMTVRPGYPMHVIKARFGQPICVLGDHPLELGLGRVNSVYSSQDPRSFRDQALQCQRL